VTRVAVAVPRATCLTQALATMILLGQEGHHSRMFIGVSRGEGQRMDAHAWVECSGEVIVGGPVPDRSARLAMPLGR
jgi:hypothetical protein